MISRKSLLKISPNRLKAFLLAVAISTLLIGLLVLAGWKWNDERLKRILPGLVSMNPVTAVCFVFAAIALALNSATELFQKRSLVWMVRFCSWFILGIGLLVTMAYLFGSEWKIDQVMFRTKLHSDSLSYPNRMAPNTAVNFILLGLSLLFLNSKHGNWRRFAELSSIAIVVNAFFALLGYVYKVQAFYSIATFIPMALHTAALFFLLGLATLFSQSKKGLIALVMSATPGGVLMRRLFPAMVITVSFLGWLRLEGERGGQYGSQLGVTLYTVANITLMGAFIIWSSRSLQQADVLRARTDLERERFFALSVDLLSIMDLNGNFKRVNPAFSSILGFTIEEMLERPSHDFIHPDDRAGTIADTKTLISGFASYRFENRYRCKNGDWKWISWKTQPFPEEGLLYATGRDITERKTNDDTLRRARDVLEHRVQERTIELAVTEAKFRALVEQSIVGIYIIQDERFVYVNPKMAEILGYSHEELAARPVTDFIVEEDRGLVAANIRKRIEGTVTHVRYFLRMKHRNGSILNVEAFGSRSDYNGRAAILGTLLDITDRTTAELALKQLNEDLERRVEERTRELKSANKELESFSYSVSHDLRAPLRHVHGYTKMLANATKDQLEPKAQRFLKMIEESTIEMGHLIDHLLAFSRMSRVELKEEIITTEDVIRQAIASFEMDVKDRNIIWKIGSMPRVKGDGALLKQVFTNLIDNAVKYSRNRDPAEIEIGCSAEDQDWLVFFVRDNGAGFDMNYAEKLFGVFQRLHRSEEFEGTGIGLAAVQRIVQRHGGRTWAEGALNKGATFYFTLKPAEIADSLTVVQSIDDASG